MSKRKLYIGKTIRVTLKGGSSYPIDKVNEYDFIVSYIGPKYVYLLCKDTTTKNDKFKIEFLRAYFWFYSFKFNNKEYTGVSYVPTDKEIEKCAMIKRESEYKVPCKPCKNPCMLDYTLSISQDGTMRYALTPNGKCATIPFIKVKLED